MLARPLVSIAALTVLLLAAPMSEAAPTGTLDTSPDTHHGASGTPRTPHTPHKAPHAHPHGKTRARAAAPNAPAVAAPPAAKTSKDASASASASKTAKTDTSEKPAAKAKAKPEPKPNVAPSNVCTPDSLEKTLEDLRSALIKHSDANKLPQLPASVAVPMPDAEPAPSTTTATTTTKANAKAPAAKPSVEKKAPRIAAPPASTAVPADAEPGQRRMRDSNATPPGRHRAHPKLHTISGSSV